jgi:hypothetical protein
MGMNEETATLSSVNHNINTGGGRVKEEEEEAGDGGVQ